ncbi:flagellar biosynthesis protein FlhF [Desulfothermus naphthae]
MQVKTYRGHSNYEILQKIKLEMGDDAIILNTKTEKVNGRKIYTIMAAKEVDTSQQKNKEKPREKFKTEEVWYREWKEFKDHIFSLLKNSLDIPSLSSRQKAAIRQLELEGVGQDFIVSLLSLLRRNSKSFMEILNSMVKIIPIDKLIRTKKCHVFVGPHGVGKTSLILKLALRYKRNNPDSRICLVNVDNYQGKGKLFLKHYAELSNFCYKDLNGLRDAAALKADFGKFDRVFIDTPGLRQGMDLDVWWEESPLSMIEDVDTHLVLSPLYSSHQIDHYLARFLSDRLTSLMWTKLDEACIFGTMIYAAFKTQLPISLITNGPQLKNSVYSVDKATLWNLIFKHKI